MTPETRAAADHLRTFLNDVDAAFRDAGANPEHHRNAPVIVASGYDLTIGDLHALLAAVDTDADTNPGTCPHCSGRGYDLESRNCERCDGSGATTLNPARPVVDEAQESIYRWTGQASHPKPGYVTIDLAGCKFGHEAVLVLEGDQIGKLGQLLIEDHLERHRPLTDEPCGLIPTQRGRQLLADYRAHRREQHPKKATGVTDNV